MLDFIKDVVEAQEEVVEAQEEVEVTEVQIEETKLEELVQAAGLEDKGITSLTELVAALEEAKVARRKVPGVPSPRLGKQQTIEPNVALYETELDKILGGTF